MTRPPVVDLALAATAAALTGLVILAETGRGPTWDVVLYVLVHLGLVAALAVRSTHRRASFVATYALLAVMAAVVAFAPINHGVSPLILCAPLALFKVARHDPAPWGAAGLLLGIAGAFVSPLHRLPGGSSSFLIALMILGIAGTYLWATGRRRTELAYQARLEDERLAAERESARRVAQAQTDERSRIAREIHDIVAHSLAVVNVQAATALAVGTPEQMRDSLTGVRASSKEALGELRSLVGVLRDEVSSGEVVGDLLRLPALAEATTAAGARLEVALPDEEVLRRWQGTWSASARLAVVRVVQESLSNVVKHGGPAPLARLSVTEDGAACVVEVTNAAVVQGESLGYGVPGLRERVTLAGGKFEAGPDGAGFAVRACIPTGAKEQS